MPGIITIIGILLLYHYSYPITKENKILSNNIYILGSVADTEILHTKGAEATGDELADILS